MVPADDQAIVLPCASVIVIMVLLNEAATCATPDAMFLRSGRRTRVACLPILNPFAPARRNRHEGLSCYQVGPAAFFLPAIVLAGPLRVRAFVCVRWPRTGKPLRCRRPRYDPMSMSRLIFIAVSVRRAPSTR